MTVTLVAACFGQSWSLLRRVAACKSWNVQTFRYLRGCTNFNPVFSEFSVILCAAKYCVVRNIVWCEILCGAKYCVLRNIVCCEILCGAKYCVLRNIRTCRADFKPLRLECFFFTVSPCILIHRISHTN